MQDPQPHDLDQLYALVAREHRNRERVMAAENRRIEGIARRLFSMDGVVIGQAQPPKEGGLYVLSESRQAFYIGMSASLYDRIKNKHATGAYDSHAGPAYALERFPSRPKEWHTEWIRTNVEARWTMVRDEVLRGAVERRLTEIVQPKMDKTRR